MLAVNRFVAGGDDLEERLGAALDALAARSGFVRGSIGRAVDDPQAWVLVTEWEGVGAYRRALSSYDVKVQAHQVLGEAIPEVGAYEIVDSRST